MAGYNYQVRVPDLRCIYHRTKLQGLKQGNAWSVTSLLPWHPDTQRHSSFSLAFTLRLCFSHHNTPPLSCQIFHLHPSCLQSPNGLLSLALLHPSSPQSTLTRGWRRGLACLLLGCWGLLLVNEVIRRHSDLTKGICSACCVFLLCFSV